MGFGRSSMMVALAGSAVLALASCSGVGGGPVANAQSEYSSLAWADGTVLRVGKVDLQEATEAEAGKDFKQISTTEQWGMGDESFGAFGLDNKGRLVGSMMTNQGIYPATNLLTSGAVVGQVIGGKFEAWPAAEGVPFAQETSRDRWRADIPTVRTSFGPKPRTPASSQPTG